MSEDADAHLPGWCCQQIAAQLSQALFAMANLHAQVSGLKEENRLLKIKIRSFNLNKVYEDIKSAGNAMSMSEQGEEKRRDECSANVKSPDSPDHISSDIEVEIVEERKGFVTAPQNSNAVLNGVSLHPIVLNVPLKQKLYEGKGGAFVGTVMQVGGDFKCDKCDCSFPTPDLLTLHQAVHISRSFHVCKVCNAMFLLKADLYRHWATHPNIKQHVCPVCGKAYTSKNNFKLHIKTHTGVGLYPCEVCGKAFHSENHLNVHRRIHTGERPFECQFCDKSFTQKSGLINHTRLHTGEKPFLCPSCPKAFTQKSNLNFHLSKHHPSI